MEDGGGIKALKARKVKLIAEANNETRKIDSEIAELLTLHLQGGSIKRYQLLSVFL